MSVDSRTRTSPGAGSLLPLRAHGVDDQTRGRAVGWSAAVLREVLTATCWLDPGDQGDAYEVTVEFSGRRVGATGRPRPGDRFSQSETLLVVPGSGPVSVTTTAKGTNPGEWLVTARPIGRGGRRLGQLPQSDGDTGPVRGPLWPSRYRRMCASRSEHAKTALLPFAPVPGVIPGAYATLVALGILVGLGMQAFVLARVQRPVGPTLTVSTWAIIAGLVGAKLWYVIGHCGRRFDGWCIHGLIFSTAFVAVTLAPARLSMPLGAYLDSMAPGLLFGMGIGRLGCFLAGCCRGRQTASRWGVWSSDQRVGARRIPTQLLESLLCFAVGTGAFILVLSTSVAARGVVFLGALVAYTLGRQFLLPLRADPRHFTYARHLVLAATVVLLVADVVWAGRA